MQRRMGESSTYNDFIKCTICKVEIDICSLVWLQGKSNICFLLFNAVLKKDEHEEA